MARLAMLAFAALCAVAALAAAAEAKPHGLKSLSSASQRRVLQVKKVATKKTAKAVKKVGKKVATKKVAAAKPKPLGPVNMSVRRYPVFQSDGGNFYRVEVTVTSNSAKAACIRMACAGVTYANCGIGGRPELDPNHLPQSRTHACSNNVNLGCTSPNTLAKNMGQWDFSFVIPAGRPSAFKFAGFYPPEASGNCDLAHHVI